VAVDVQDAGSGLLVLGLVGEGLDVLDGRHRRDAEAVDDLADVVGGGGDLGAWRGGHELSSWGRTQVADGAPGGSAIGDGGVTARKCGRDRSINKPGVSPTGSVAVVLGLVGALDGVADVGGLLVAQ